MKKITFLLATIGFSFIVTIDSFAEGKDLRPLFEKYGLTVKNQTPRPTCSVFAIVGLVEFEIANTIHQTTPLSVEYLNWASNMITGNIVDGSMFDDAIDGLLMYGICSNDYFPYYSSNYTTKVEPSNAAKKDAEKRIAFHYQYTWIKEWDPKTGMTDNQLNIVKEQLEKEHPVAIGFQWPKKEKKYNKMIDGMMYVPPREGVFDGHSVLIVGYQDDPKVPGGGYFIFKNSYGKEYGEQGYGKMPYEYVNKYANDGVAIYIK